MTHAIHHYQGQRVDTDVLSTYEYVMKTGKYSEVRQIDGQKCKSYATTNDREYLAETAEAFFSSKRFRNNSYPYVNSELKTFDEDGWKLITRVFELSDEWVADFISKMEPPADYDPKTGKYQR